MAMPITQKLADAGATVYYDQAFRRVLETHMGLLRNLQETRYIEIEKHLAYKYEFDFYGLLQELKIPMNLHWVIMRVNNMVDPREFKSTMERFLFPPAEVVDNIRKLHATTAQKL
ncbi:hypothetical protein D3C81_193450 [compost metagenome]|jgi:hypothetical protein